MAVAGEENAPSEGGEGSRISTQAQARRWIRDSEWYTEEILATEDGVPTRHAGYGSVLREPVAALSAAERASIVGAYSIWPETVSPSVEAWLAGDSFDDERVVLRLRRADRTPDDLPPAYLVASSALAGRPLSPEGARSEAVARLVARRDGALEAWRRQVPAGITSWEAVDSVVPAVRVQAPREVVRALLQNPLVAGAEMHQEGAEVPDDGTPIPFGDAEPIDGLELTSLIQAGQFYDRGFKGSLTAVVTEGHGDWLHVEHPGFRDSPTGPSRAMNCRNLPATSCSNWTGDETDPATYWHHSTGVASILGGDITQGQDGVYSGAAAERRSGVAREAQILGLADYDNSVHTLLQSQDVVAVNRSASNGVNCESYGSREFSVDAVYELGVPFFKSAGNENNNAMRGNCTIGSPGFASGAFVVGAYNVDSVLPVDDPNTPVREDLVVEEGRLDFSSSYGGDPALGFTRTLVDLVAPTLHENVYPHYQWPLLVVLPDMYGMDSESDGIADEAFCCTSGATPVVTGATLLYREWADSVGGLAADPGILYVRLLLMGDRWDGLTDYLTTGYSRRSGAGRLRLRQYDEIGLDGPYAQKAGSVCVGDGESVYVNFNAEAALSADIDMLKAVTWSYRNDESDTPVFNDVDLAVQYRATFTIKGMPTPTWITTRSDTGTDDKRRVYLEQPQALPHRLRLTGASVAGTDAVCGVGRQRVYYAILAEDSDRESAEGLNAVRTE